MNTIQVALGLIFDGNGKFLITLRNDPDNSRAHLKWEIPGGGVEKGESIKDAASRELKEEIGISVLFLPYDPIITYVRNLVISTFLCQMSSDKISLDLNEAIEYKWVTFNELKKLPFLVKTDEIVEKASRLLSKDNYD